MFCVFLGKPLQFSGSQLSTFRNEQLEELFRRPLSADKCRSALLFSILLRHSLKRVFPLRKVLQRRKYTRYVFLAEHMFRTVRSVRHCKRWKENGDRRLMLSLQQGFAAPFEECKESLCQELGSEPYWESREAPGGLICSRLKFTPCLALGNSDTLRLQ